MRYGIDSRILKAYPYPTILKRTSLNARAFWTQCFRAAKRESDVLVFEFFLLGKAKVSFTRRRAMASIVSQRAPLAAASPQSIN